MPMSFLNSSLLPFGWLLVIILTVIVHLACCVGIASDATKLRRQARGPFFLLPYQWAAAGLLTGLLGVGIYWAIHHSTISTLPSNSKHDS